MCRRPLLRILVALLSLTACLAAGAPHALAADRADIEVARRNGGQAAELFARCHRFVEGWLAHCDPESGLIPQNLKSPIWTPENSAADNYPFMVLTAYITDPELLDGTLTDILHTEIRLTTRVGALPDAFSFETQSFARRDIDWTRLIFGASEYCKDGLLPVTELMGRGEWLSRLRDIAADICEHAPVETRFGRIPATSAEVNGEMMQVVSRLYPATGDPRFLRMALRLGDAYFLEVLPGNGFLPCHSWDFSGHSATNPTLRLIDHGSEIVGGLSEIYILACRYAPEEARQYEPAMRGTMDALLDRCIKEDGLWYGSYDTNSGEGSGGPPDTWGYLFNAVYAYYMLSGEERCRAAVERGLKAICGHEKWGGADAYADSIESAVVLLNRIDVPETWEWVDRMTAAMSAIQQEDGVIEGWHGDGNVARTWLMVALAKTRGLRPEPWRPAVRVGAAMSEGKLVLSVRADKAWSGRLRFDYPRHRDHFGMSPNYPRLNEYAEWFTVDDGHLYSVQPIDESGSPTPDSPTVHDGGFLRRGLPLEVQAGGEFLALVEHLGGPPYGIAQLELRGSTWAAGAGDAEITLLVKNRSAAPTRVELSSDWGAVAPERVTLAPRQLAALAVRGTIVEETEAVVTARSGPGTPAASHRIHLVADTNVTDYRDLSGSNTYKDEDYWWLNEGDLDLRLRTEPRRDHVISFYWGCKNDTRIAELTLADEKQRLTQSGYDGFRWHDIEVPADKVPGSTLYLKLAKPTEGRPAFLGRLKVRTR